MNEDRVRATLIKFFREHNPEQLPVIDDIIQAFSDTTPDELFDSLSERYGVPVMPVSHQEAQIILNSEATPTSNVNSNNNNQPSPLRHQPSHGSWSTSGGGSPRNTLAAAGGVRRAGSSDAAHNPIIDEIDYDIEHSDEIEGQPAHPAESFIRRGARGEEVLEIPSRAAVSIVIANDASMKSGTLLPIQNVDAVLEDEKRRALLRARQEAMEMVKKANRDTKAMRERDPHLFMMNDPSDILAYRQQKAISDERAQAVARSVHEMQRFNPQYDDPNMMNNTSTASDGQQQQRDTSFATTSMTPQQQQTPSRSVLPATSSLSSAWAVLNAATPPPPPPKPLTRSMLIRPGQPLPPGMRRQQQPQQPTYVSNNMGHMSRNATTGGSTVANNSITSSVVDGSRAWSRSSSHHSEPEPKAPPPPPAEDEDRLVVPHSPPLNTSTTTTTTLYKKDDGSQQKDGGKQQGI